MVSDPVRAGPLLGAAMNCTRPLPVPDPPAVNVIQSTSLAAVQVQAPVTITRIFPLPPLEPKTCDGGAMTQVHDDDWLMVTT
jgi:hypothetical protein